VLRWDSRSCILRVAGARSWPARSRSSRPTQLAIDEIQPCRSTGFAEGIQYCSVLTQQSHAALPLIERRIHVRHEVLASSFCRGRFSSPGLCLLLLPPSLSPSCSSAMAHSPWATWFLNLFIRSHSHMLLRESGRACACHAYVLRVYATILVHLIMLNQLVRPLLHTDVHILSNPI
jgi:hypothetical protein